MAGRTLVKSGESLVAARLEVRWDGSSRFDMALAPAGEIPCKTLYANVTGGSPLIRELDGAHAHMRDVGWYIEISEANERILEDSVTFHYTLLLHRRAAT